MIIAAVSILRDIGLQKLINRMAAFLEEHGIDAHAYRAFTDSAPVLEKPLAEQAGLGWIGKNTLLINQHAGSWFFLGEIYTNLPLPLSIAQATNRCGSCTACIDVCPTDAIVAPYELDARKCISYLTIEYGGVIPVELRKPIGNRIFGCDDCQTCCPWNRYATHTTESDFQPRHGLNDAALLDLFAWTEAEFLQRTEGSAIRRTGYQAWLRNIAIALGNAEPSPLIVQALKAKRSTTDVETGGLVDTHIQWALEQQTDKG